MPAVLALLPALAAAIALLLFAVIVDWLIAHAQATIPNPSILGVAPLGWVHNWLSDLHNWVIDAEDDANAAISVLFVDGGWLFSRITGAAMNALSNLLGLVRHTANVVVVDAIHSAESYAVTTADAIGHTAHLELVASVTSIEATLATDEHYAENIVNAIIPGAINALHNTVDTAIGDLSSSLQHNIDALSTDLVNDLAQVWGQVNPLFDFVYTTLTPEVIQNAISEKSDIAAAEALAHSQLVASVNNIEDSLTAIRQQIGVNDGAIIAINGQISALDTTDADYGTKLATLNGQIGVINGTIDTLTNQADGLATQLSAAQSQINTINGTAAITLPGLPDITIPGSIIVPAAVAGLGAIVADIALEIERCMVSTCEGPNNISNLVSGLLGGVDLAEMALFLKQAISDPGSAAASFAGVGQSLYQDADSFFDNLLGI